MKKRFPLRRRSKLRLYFDTLRDAILGRKPPEPEVLREREVVYVPREVVLLDELRLAATFGLSTTFCIDGRTGGLSVQIVDRRNHRAREQTIPRWMLDGISAIGCEAFIADMIRKALDDWRTSRLRKLFDDPNSVPLDYQI